MAEDERSAQRGIRKLLTLGPDCDPRAAGAIGERLEQHITDHDEGPAFLDFFYELFRSYQNMVAVGVYEEQQKQAATTKGGKISGQAKKDVSRELYRKHAVQLVEKNPRFRKSLRSLAEKLDEVIVRLIHDGQVSQELYRDPDHVRKHYLENLGH